MSELTEAEVERLCGWAVHPGADPSALLDTVAAIIDARLAPIRGLADEWADADGETVSVEGLTALTVTNRRGRDLRAALDASSADLTASQDHDGTDGRRERERPGDGGLDLDDDEYRDFMDGIRG